MVKITTKEKVADSRREFAGPPETNFNLSKVIGLKNDAAKPVFDTRLLTQDGPQAQVPLTARLPLKKPAKVQSLLHDYNMPVVAEQSPITPVIESSNEKQLATYPVSPSKTGFVMKTRKPFKEDIIGQGL